LQHIIKLKMIDLACIFTTGGVVLFYKSFCDIKFDIIDQLIRKVIISNILNIIRSSDIFFISLNIYYY
jgi:hypothetical protein